ncbi:hypothetical protein CLU96_0957 [Chryseobacterium sp. 52]|nr:hypothetical protein CLU96_0957 [Chryseobacterium sp. 52]
MIIKDLSIVFFMTLKNFGETGVYILRNKKPEIFTTSGFDILLYYYSKNVPNHEALPP